MTTVDSASGDGAPGDTATGGVDPRTQTPPEQRGRLDIADRVIEKIAAHAAAEVDHATGSPRRVLGLTVGDGDNPGTPQVTARVHGDVATVVVDLVVTWPAPITEVTRAVRAAVIDRLTTLAGIGTAQVDIQVSALTAPRREQRRVA